MLVSGACGLACRSEKFDLCVWSMLERGGKGELQFTERGDVPLCTGRGRDGFTCAVAVSMCGPQLSVAVFFYR